MKVPMTVAVVGTGRMGGAMVATLRRAGFPVRVWNRTSAVAREVGDRTGAEVAATVIEAVTGGGRRDLEPRRRRRGARDVHGIDRRRRRRARGPDRPGDEHDRAADRPPRRIVGRGAWRDVAGCSGLRQRADGGERRAHDHGGRRPRGAGARTPRPGRARHEGLPRRSARRGSHRQARRERARPRDRRRALRGARAGREGRRRSSGRLRRVRRRCGRRAVRAVQADGVRASGR